VQPDDRALTVDEITLVVQVNGKVRARLTVPVDIAEEDAVAMAMRDPNVVAHIEGKEIRKRIYVAGKLVNIVAA
jgi:leucyl-tRNA synthetase